jgi:hypothetical protein
MTAGKHHLGFGIHASGPLNKPPDIRFSLFCKRATVHDNKLSTLQGVGEQPFPLEIPGHDIGIPLV